MKLIALYKQPEDPAAFDQRYFGEHVPLVERSIRTVKERNRATIHGNPFKLLPRVLIKSVVQECTRQLNFFPAKGGCSEYYSPREILHEEKMD